MPPGSLQSTTGVKCLGADVDTTKVMPGTASSTPTIAVRVVVVVLAVLIPMVFGVWDRLLARVDDRPTPTASTGERLLLPSLLVPFDPSFTFTRTQPDSSKPVAFDPCRRIEYVVRTAGAPADGKALIDQSLGRISEASGLMFVDAGSTDEGPEVDRPNFQPDRYGDRWAPVLITWSNPVEYPPLAGSVIGVASSEPVDAPDGKLALVSGQVTLDADQMAQQVGAGNRAVALAVVTHELGHLVGLGHVNDERQLMYPSARPLVTAFGPGDLTGLAALGSGTCFDSL